MRPLVLLVVLVTGSLITASGQDSESSVRLSPKSVVKLYCQKDFDGARTTSKTLSEVDHLYLWPDEPGWSIATLVRHWGVLSSHVVDSSHAVVTVEYETLGDISAWELKEEHKSTRVEFKLELGNKEWGWNNNQRVLVTSNLAWRITAPIMPPHISILYAKKYFASLPRDDRHPNLGKVLAQLRAIQ